MEKLKDYLHLYTGCEMYSSNENNTYTLFAHNLDYALLYDDKPLLRILPSMTDYEKESMYNFIFPQNESGVNRDEKVNFIEWYLDISNDYPSNFVLFENLLYSMTFYDNCRLINHLLKMHFDLFGLIEKGLALDLNKQT